MPVFQNMKVVINSKMITTENYSSHCIFCTSQCSSSFTIINGKPVKLKIENENASKPFLSRNFKPGTQDDSCIESHLKVIFILRKILNIEVTTFFKFLGKCEGQFHPGLWISLCSSCDQLVGEFWEKLKEIGRLERRLKDIKSELTGFVQDTQTFNRNGDDPVWNEIRKKVVAETGSTNHFEEKFHIERLMVTTLEREDKFAGEDQVDRFRESDGEEPLIRVELLDNNKYKNVEDPIYHSDPLSDSNLQAEPQTKKGRRKNFGCSVCSKLFDREKHLKTHYNNYHTEINCKSCDKKFASLKLLTGHEKRVHTPKGNFPCPTCFKEFASYFTLWRHKRSSHEKKTSQCSTCGRSFKSASSLSYHVNTVHNPSPVACPHCQAVFCHKINLRNHLKLKHSDGGKPTAYKPVTCSKCGKLFSCSRAVSRHMHLVHGLAPKRRFNCSECDVVVKSEQQLNHHIKAVHNPETHICPICDNIFTTAKYLNQHVTRTHSTPEQKESWTKCPNCEMRFYQKYLLKNHLLHSSCRLGKREQTQEAEEQE